MIVNIILAPNRDYRAFQVTRSASNVTVYRVSMYIKLGHALRGVWCDPLFKVCASSLLEDCLKCTY